MTLTTDELDIDGRRLHAAMNGDGDTTITLLHGGLIDSSSWGDLLPALAARLRVVTFDIAGYGRSDPAPDRNPLTGAAEDCLRVWEHFGVTESWVLGFSQGGFIALRLTAMAPARIAGLVLVSTAATLDEAGRRVMRERAARLREDGMAQDVEAHLARAFSPEFTERCPDVVAAYAAGVAASDAAVVAATLEALADADETPVLRGISAPTLVVLGEHDRGFSSVGASTAAAIPGARLVTLPETGHTIHIERPGDLHDLVTGFIADHTRRATESRASTSDHTD